MLATRLEVFIDILLYILICLILSGVLKGNITSKFKCFLASFLILLFFLFAYWGGDYFHYKEGFDVVKQNSNIELGFEEIYFWIISISPSYLFFRFVVWGGCFAILLYILSRLKIPTGIGLLSIAAFSLLRLSYARASLAMAIMCLGVALIANPYDRKKFLSVLVGVAVIFASYFFHKSAYFGIVMAVFAIILSNMNKKGASLIMIVVILLASFLLVRTYIGDLMMATIDPDDSDLSLEVGQRYLGRDISEVGWGGRIRNIVEMVPYYIGLWIYIRLRTKGVLRICSKPMLIFANLFLMIILVSSVFLFRYGNYNTVFLYHRFMRYNLIPLAVFMAFCYMNGYEKKLVKFNLYVGMLVALYALAYSFLHT